MRAEILSIDPARDKQNEIVFRLIDDSVKPPLEYGPMVECRPGDEKPDEFVVGYLAAWEANAAAYVPPDPKQMLRDQVLADPALAKAALNIDDKKLAEIAGLQARADEDGLAVAEIALP